MFLPVNEKTVAASVFTLITAFVAGRVLPAEAWDFVRNNDIAVLDNRTCCPVCNLQHCGLVANSADSLLR